MPVQDWWLYFFLSISSFAFSAAAVYLAAVVSALVSALQNKVDEPTNREVNKLNAEKLLWHRIDRGDYRKKEEHE